MPRIVYDEAYGTLSFAQRAAYRKHNVPPAMHDMLVARFGEDHATITRFVNETVARRGRIDYSDVM